MNSLTQSQKTNTFCFVFDLDLEQTQTLDPCSSALFLPFWLYQMKQVSYYQTIFYGFSCCYEFPREKKDEIMS